MTATAPTTDREESDEFGAFLAEQMKDPTFARHYRQASARAARAVQVPCAWGNCRHDVDPVNGTILGSVGPVGCPCDNLPGWRSARVAGQARPAVPAKPRGRHGSRIQRSRLRHTLPTEKDATDD